MWHDRDSLSIAEIILFTPLSILSFITCFRHGFKRSSGWIYTLILCTVRIVGAVCQLVGRSDHSTGLIRATIIIDSIGLSPLLLATIGLLHRFVDFVNTGSLPMFTAKHFRILHLLVVVGLILSVAGGSSANAQPDGTIQVATTSKVGIILYIVSFIGIVLIYAFSVPRTYVVPKKERRVPVAITFALVLVLVRLIYSACSVFLHNHLFNIVTGSIAVRVCMAVLEELFVVSIYTVLGFFVDEVDENGQGQVMGYPLKQQDPEQIPMTRRPLRR